MDYYINAAIWLLAGYLLLTGWKVLVNLGGIFWWASKLYDELRHDDADLAPGEHSPLAALIAYVGFPVVFYFVLLMECPRILAAEGVAFFFPYRRAMLYEMLSRDKQKTAD